MTHKLIVGGGPAATNAVETIRQFDQECRITLLSNEPAHSRMALPYWLSGQIPREHTHTADPAYFQRLKVDARIGEAAAAIDTNAKTVTTESGDSLAFDQLLLATGSRPLSLPVEGGDLPQVTAQWTLDQVAASLALLESHTQPRVVLVGAGFIGFIILSALYKRGCQLTVVEREKHVLPKMLSDTSAGYVERWLGEKQITVHTGTDVTAIREGGQSGRHTVVTSAGELEADLVVVAIGVAPQIELATSAQLATDHGILVNEHLQTSHPDIFAAGDCAQGPALFTDQPQIHAIHPTAVDHGRVAGANMAGQNVRYDGSLSMNVLDVCGLQCVSYGNWQDEAAESMEISSPGTNVYRNLLWTGDQITGAMFVGQANQVGMLTDVGMVKGLMQTKTALGPWKEFLSKNPFDIRRAYLGSGVAARLAQTTLLGQAATARSYRFGNPEPKAKVSSHHATYVGPADA